MSYLEKRSILISVVILLARMLPRYPENGFLLILPNQAQVAFAVNLIDQPLSKLPVAATDRQGDVLLEVHVCSQTTRLGKVRGKYQKFHISLTKNVKDRI